MAGPRCKPRQSLAARTQFPLIMQGMRETKFIEKVPTIQNEPKSPWPSPKSTPLARAMHTPHSVPTAQPPYLHTLEHRELRGPVVWCENGSVLIFCTSLFLTYPSSFKPCRSRPCRPMSLLNSCLIPHGLDLISPPLIGICIVSLGLLETDGTVAKSGGLGITPTWVRMLACVTLEGLLSLSEPWVPICPMGTSQAQCLRSHWQRVRGMNAVPGT